MINSDDAFSSFYSLNKLRNLKFSSNTYDIAFTMEYNFRNYDLFNTKMSNFTPFLILGIGAIISETEVTEKIRNQKLNFKAQSASIPFGFGFKFRIKKKLGLNLFWLYNKTFTDDLDGISSFNLTFSKNQQGYKSDNDWFSFIGISILYRVSIIDKTCVYNYRRQGYEYR